MLSLKKNSKGRIISLMTFAARWTVVLVIVMANLLSPKYSIFAQTPSNTSYYVSTTGSNSNPGTLAQPWRTLTYAGQKITAGSTLYIRGGTYQEHSYIYNSGTQASPIVVTNYNNEEVIIDGINMTLPAHNSGTPLIGVLGDWVTVSNLTISNSGEYGVTVEGSHDVLNNLYVHHNWSDGIILTGDYGLAQNSRVWSNAMDNEGGTMSSSWGAGIYCGRYPDYCTIHHNLVWENWGEGINAGETLHPTVEDNVAYDNMLNFYIHDTKYALFQRNLSYYSPGTVMDFNTTNGLYVDDEHGGVPIPLGSGGTRYPSSDNTFINNLIIGGNHGLETGTSANNNNLYAYNTFGNSAGNTVEPVNILLNPGTCTNCRFINNIVEQDDTRSIISVQGTGFAFSNNLWSKAPSSKAVGQGDMVGDPLLAKTGSLAPGQLTADYFKLLSSSPAIDKGMTLSTVLTDYFLNSRDAHPDIGADEFTVPATNTPVPPTATSTLTPTSIPPTATYTPTNTSIPPTTTFTPTRTSIPPTATYTPTRTPIPPTATFTPTRTPIPPTATFTSTRTPIPPTSTSTPTNTPSTPAPTSTQPTIAPTNTALPNTPTASPTLGPTATAIPDLTKNTKLARSPWPKGRGKSSNQALSAFNGPSQTSLLWSYSTGGSYTQSTGSGTGSSPVLGTDGTLYASLGSSLVALSPSGDVLWSFDTGGTVTSSLLTSDGTLYFGSADRKFYSVSAVDGSLNWTYRTNGAITAPPNIAADGTLYIPSTDGILYALDPSGTLKWSFVTGSSISASPAVSDDGSIVFGATNGQLFSLDPDSALNWSYHANGSIISAPAIASDGTIYFGSTDRNLYAIDPDGSLKWTYHTRGTVSSPAIASDGTIYAGSTDKKLYAISPTGSLVWSYLAGGTVNAPVISQDGTLYVGSNDGYLYTITRDGTFEWKYFVGGFVSFDPVLDASGNIYIGSSGSIHSIGTLIVPVPSQWHVFLPGIFSSGS